MSAQSVGIEEGTGMDTSEATEPQEREGAGEAPVGEAEGEEVRRPRISRRPMAPTKEMVEEHSRTHSEYRDWCPDCRAGKSTGLHHRQGDPTEDKIGTTISIDYAFRQPDEKEDDLIPVLVAYDNVKKSIWALEVDAKGITDNGAAVDCIVAKFDG